MNADTAQFIENYRKMIAQYASKVDPGNSALRDCNEIVRQFIEIGNRYAEVYEFMADPAVSSLMTKISISMTALATDSLAESKKRGTMKIPTAAEAALGYHKAFEAMVGKEKHPETCRVYERVFELERSSQTAPEFLARIAEEGLILKMSTAPLMEEFQPLVKQAEDVSVPTMAFHNEEMLRLAGSAQSVTELQVETERLVQLNRMEVQADLLLTNDLFHIVGNAVTSYLLSATEENRQSVEYAVRFVADFFSVGPDELFQIPRVRDQLRFMVDGMNKSPGAAPTTIEAEESKLKAGIDRALRGHPPVIKGPASRREVCVWGKRVPVDRYLDAVRHPERPQHLLR